jgi:hypothetical protein
MWLAGTMPLSTNIGLPRDAADPKHDEKKGGAWGNKIKTCYGKKTKMLNNVKRNRSKHFKHQIKRSDML